MIAPSTTLSSGPFSSTISAGVVPGSAGEVVSDFSSRPSTFPPRNYAQTLCRPDLAQSSLKRSYAPTPGSCPPVVSGSPSSFRRRRDEELFLAPNGHLPFSSGNGIAWRGRDSAFGRSVGRGGEGNRESSPSSSCSPLEPSLPGRGLAALLGSLLKRFAPFLKILGVFEKTSSFITSLINFLNAIPQDGKFLTKKDYANRNE